MRLVRLMDAETYRFEVDAERPLGELGREYPQADRVVALPQTLSTQQSKNSTEKKKHTHAHGRRITETHQQKQETNRLRKRQERFGLVNGVPSFF